MKRGMLTSGKGRERMGNYCEFHEEMGHMIQNCEEFKAMVQGLMVNKELQIF